MDFFYYSRQWPGSILERLLRSLHVLFLELRRLVLGKKYIAEFDLTDNCNLRCPHCFHFRHIGSNQTEPKSIEAWQNLFKKLYKKGIRRVLLIGGEPALRLDVIRLATNIFPYIDICSNGTIKIDDFYTQKIFVSIDGTEDYHDKLRGPGIFSKVLGNYTGDKRVVLSMTVTKDNLAHLEYVIKLAIAHNMMGVSCDIYTPSPAVREQDALFVNENDRKAIVSKFRSLKKKYPRHFLMSHSAIKWFERSDHSRDACYWRQAVLHFDSQLNERESCKDLDCANCGHFAQANLNPLNFLIPKEKLVSK